MPSAAEPFDESGAYISRIKNNVKNTVLGDLHVQNYSHASATTYNTDKPTKVTTMFSYSRTNTSNSNWYLNIVGGYHGTSASDITTANHRDAAKAVQPGVVTNIKNSWDNGTAGPLGMVLVDFSCTNGDGTNTLAGHELILALIDNNFKDNVLRVKSGN